MSSYFFGGINGTGKSTIIEQIRWSVPEVKIKHTTSMLMERLSITPGDYDSLRGLSEDYKTAQNESMLTGYLVRADEEENTTLLDSHYLNMIEGKVTRLIRGEWPRYLGAMVLIEADIEQVHQRIINENASRERRLFPAAATHGKQRDILRAYSVQTRNEFFAVAAKFKLPYLIIVNDADVTTAANIFVDFMAKIR
jgi:adenylate kinase